MYVVRDRNAAQVLGYYTTLLHDIEGRAPTVPGASARAAAGVEGAAAAHASVTRAVERGLYSGQQSVVELRDES